MGCRVVGWALCRAYDCEIGSNFFVVVIACLSVKCTGDSSEVIAQRWWWVTMSVRVEVVGWW